MMTADIYMVLIYPSLKNLSGGLNLSRGSNFVGFTYIFITFFKT